MRHERMGNLLDVAARHLISGIETPVDERDVHAGHDLRHRPVPLLPRIDVRDIENRLAGPPEHVSHRVRELGAMRYGHHAHIEDPVHVGPAVHRNAGELQPPLVDQKAPGGVVGEHALHAARTVTGGRRDTDALTAQEGESQVVPHMGVRQENPVERIPAVRPLAERRFLDEIHLSGQTRRRVYQIETLSRRIHDGEGGHVARRLQTCLLTPVAVAPGLG